MPTPLIMQLFVPLIYSTQARYLENIHLAVRKGRNKITRRRVQITEKPLIIFLGVRIPLVMYDESTLYYLSMIEEVI